MNIKEETVYSNVETANSKQLAILKKHFPNCFDRNGNFIQERMLEVVNDSEIELSKESYSLNWLGKSYSRLLANLPPCTLMKEDNDHNSKPVHHGSKNLLLKGDNLEVLKHLTNAYTEKVKMIYIDPPYNTEKDSFIYEDSRSFTAEQIAELTGVDIDEAKRVLSFTESKSNSHSAWLTFMYPRLRIASELLSEDGIIFISIDDNEVAQLRILCDEIFGEHSFVSELVWHLSSGPQAGHFTRSNEFILCYAKNKEKLPFFKDTSGGTIKHGALKKISKVNPASEVTFKKGSIRYEGKDAEFSGVLGQSEKQFIKSEKMVFENGILAEDVVIEAGWAMKRQLESWLAGNETFDTKGQKVLRFYFNSNGILFYEKERGTEHPKTVLSSTDVGNTKDGGVAVETLLGNKYFDFPKPVPLIKKLISLCTSDNDIVLDFFAGTGTTAHAVFEQNLDNDKNLQCISVQWAEDIEDGHIAKVDGYETIFDITKARIAKASEKLRADNPTYLGDLGFRVFETVEDFRVEDNDKELELTNFTMFDDVLLTEEQHQTLLTTWALYDGSELTTPIHDIDLNGYTAHLCDRRLYMIAPDFSSNALKALLHKLDDTNDKDFDPNKIVYYANNFDSVRQLELNEALKSYANKKSIEIDVVVRN